MTESPAVPPMQPADVPLTAQSLEVSLTVPAVRPGAVRILLTQEDGAKGVNRLKGEGFSFQITTLQPIDAIAGRANQAGAVLDLEATDAFGARVFQLSDPDAFRIAVSSPRET